MITEKRYLKAKKIVAIYEMEQLNKHNVMRNKNFLADILKMKQLPIETIKSTDKINVAQFIMQDASVFIGNYPEIEMDKFIALNL
jgi:hypothetical protein